MSTANPGQIQPPFPLTPQPPPPGLRPGRTRRFPETSDCARKDLTPLPEAIYKRGATSATLLQHPKGATHAEHPSNVEHTHPDAYDVPPQPYAKTRGFALSLLRQLRLPILAFFYVGIFVFIDQYVDNINRYFIFCNLLVVSSLYFSWYLGGRETMLYVAFFNLFFAFIFSRLMYVSKVISAPLFLGKSFLLLYVITLVFMTFMIKKESPADRKRRRRKQVIKEEFQRNRQLELMVATQKVSQDVVRQATGQGRVAAAPELLALANPIPSSTTSPPWPSASSTTRWCGRSRKTSWPICASWKNGCPSIPG